MVIDNFKRAINIEDAMTLASTKSPEGYYNENPYQSLRCQEHSSSKPTTRSILQRLHGRTVSITTNEFRNVGMSLDRRVLGLGRMLDKFKG